MTEKLKYDDRIERALSVLTTDKARQAFIAFHFLYPECSIFWTDDSAILEADEIRIEIT